MRLATGRSPITEAVLRFDFKLGLHSDCSEVDECQCYRSAADLKVRADSNSTVFRSSRRSVDAAVPAAEIARTAETASQHCYC